MSEQIRCDWCDSKPRRALALQGTNPHWITFQKVSGTTLHKERFDFCDAKCLAGWAAAERNMMLLEDES